MAIDNRWVFVVKTNSKNEVISYKARFVARGFTQRPGIDYEDTYSPVTRPEMIRTMLAVAAQQGWKLEQFDVKTAFLNGRLEEELYMRQPMGFDDQTDWVCRLNCSIYGLKQSSKCWFQCLTEFLEEKGIKPSSVDPLMYFMENQQHQEDDLVLCFHVDDGLQMGVKAKLEEFLQKLKTRFEDTFFTFRFFEFCSGVATWYVCCTILWLFS